MIVVKPDAKIMSHKEVTPYQFIERVGRTCYKSLDHITETSAEKFVHDLCTRKHYAMMEHHWVHIQFDCAPSILRKDIFLFVHDYLGTNGGITDIDKFLHVTTIEDRAVYISAPLRVFLEMDNLIKTSYDKIPANEFKYLPTKVVEIMNAVAREFPDLISLDDYKHHTQRCDVVEEERFLSNLCDDLRQCGETDYTITHEVMKHRPITVWFQCDRGVSHELVRHRPASFAQESTRYCNYSKGKFGEQITVVKPFFYKDWTDLNKNYPSAEYAAWNTACEMAERAYLKLLSLGSTPQEARSVLPNSLKTEIIVTANELEWQHIIDLRYLALTGAPHPQMKEVMSLVVFDLVKDSAGRLYAGGESNV